MPPSTVVILIIVHTVRNFLTTQLLGSQKPELNQGSSSIKLNQQRHLDNSIKHAAKNDNL
jgi:hypothetical protein